MLYVSDDDPSNPEYTNFEKYGVQGVRNFYIPVKDMYTNDTIELGAWHLVPEELVNDTITYPDFDFENHLTKPLVQ